MNELAELLIKNNISIGTVESFTVGNFATMLGNIPGISKVYKGSLVTYQSETKERLLGIEHPLIEKYGVVSKEIATLMCVNGKSILDVDLCVSFTGNAGPDAMEGKPVGEVYIGIAYEDVVVYKLNLEGSRKEIALKAIDFAQKKIIEFMVQNQVVKQRLHCMQLLKYKNKVVQLRLLMPNMPLILFMLKIWELILMN